MKIRQSSGYIKIESCNDSAKWYNSLVGNVIKYDGVVPGLPGTFEYRCRQPDGLVNFVSDEDAREMWADEIADLQQARENDNRSVYHQGTDEKVNYAKHITVDRFDLENQIMDCWGVTNDIELMTKYFVDSPHFANMSPELTDAIMNKYFGIQELYEVKFESLWNTFESLIAQGKLK